MTKRYFVFILILTILITPLLTTAKTENVEYLTNWYTQTDDLSKVNNAIKISKEFLKVADTNNLELYVNPKTLQILIKNKKTNYIFSSQPSEQQLKGEQLNQEWQNAIKSPFIIQYFNDEGTLNVSNVLSENGYVKQFRKINNGFQAEILLKNLKISIKYSITIKDSQLVLSINHNDIKELGSIKISTIQPYPFLGATKKAMIPGYIFIPDGSGALIRFQNFHPNYDEPYVGDVYSTDKAITSYFMSFGEEMIHVPVFGMVHGIKQNAFLAIIDQGKYNAQIVAYPSGVNTNFYWVSPRFIIRYGYFQPTSKNMGGVNTYQKEKNTEDIKINYYFLSNADADYVGMAKQYRNYLIEKKILKKNSSFNNDLKIELLMADSEPGLLGDKVVTMTTFKQAENILRILKSNKINNFQVVLKGWNKLGLHGKWPNKFPYEKSLGTKEDLNSLLNYSKKENIPLFFYDNYTLAYDGSLSFSLRNDTVRKITNEILQLPLFLVEQTEIFGESKDIYYISPKKALDLAKRDSKWFNDYKIQNLAIDRLGYELFSDYNKKYNTKRKDAVSIYRNLIDYYRSKNINIALYKPFDYLFDKIDVFYDMPIHSSQYTYSTDTVPFLEIVLHGFVNYYAKYSNFFENPQEELLRLIDYGCYPSFIVTNEQSWKLKYSPSNNIYTSYYKDWLDDIIYQYSFVKKALENVKQATIEDRKVIDVGIVEIRYSNNYKIYINYTSKQYNYKNITIKPKNFVVVKG